MLAAPEIGTGHMGNLLIVAVVGSISFLMGLSSFNQGRKLYFGTGRQSDAVDAAVEEKLRKRRRLYAVIRFALILSLVGLYYLEGYRSTQTLVIFAVALGIAGFKLATALLETSADATTNSPPRSTKTAKDIMNDLK